MQKRHTGNPSQGARGSEGPQRNAKPTLPEPEEIAKDDSAKLDELGIERGQNAEKGNTTKPENVRDVKKAAH